ncbi:SpoIIE family protein phosphatase [Cryptosporangium aurantiacum]|uniref:Serine/threonine-protein kinase RsbW n=1 Tax=Cryptosporangium aurantiacum TaxID=134849 RepID=A0A1M7H111_9ACTN|nr:SpoIIE family protein phosphatase [Cryptosporangium aurantiacum]SHM21839.1 serine/threonine-protein kinase RsbW [Cryptosporangium aurantiacum]
MPERPNPAAERVPAHPGSGRRRTATRARRRATPPEAGGDIDPEGRDIVSGEPLDGDPLDQAPCGFVITDPGGLIRQVNRHFLASTGYRADDLVGRVRFQDLLAPGHQIFYETHYSPLLLMQGSVREIAVDIRDARGEKLPMLVNAVLDRDGAGEPRLIRSTVFGASDRRRYERELLTQRQRAERSEARVRTLQRVAAELAAAGVLAEVGGVLVRAAMDAVEGDRGGLWLLDRREVAKATEADLALGNDGPSAIAGLSHYGLVQIAAVNIPEIEDLAHIPLPDPSAFTARRRGPVLFDSADPASDKHPMIAAAMERTNTGTLVVIPLDVGDHRLGVLAAGCTESRRLSDEDRELLHALGRQGGQALERAGLHAEATKAAERSDFLATTGRTLEEEVGLVERAQRLVELVTRELADMASVEFLEADGTRRLADARAEHCDAAVPGSPIGIEPGRAGDLITQVISGSRPKLVSERLPMGPAGPRPANWWLALPLRASGRTLGALVLGRYGRSFSVDEVTFCSEVAATAALALDNARRYEQEREVAFTLQRSLLAGGLPRRQGLRIATHYRPAMENLEVGGDWYDAFELEGEKIGIVVGDVVGRGLTAASAMGQIRSAIRALAGAGLGPAALLGQLDRFVGQFDAGRMATLVYLELTPRTGHVRYACAGHFPPLLVHGNEEAQYLWEGRSTPLDAYAGQPGRSEAEVMLQPGARLVLYTDGLVERRGRLIWRGLELLREEMEKHRTSSAAAIVNEIADAMLRDESSRDDVCLLAVSLADSTPFEETIPADLGELTGVRNRLRAWLADHDVDKHDGFAIVLACSEAIGNAIEHGYRGPVAAATGAVTISASIVDERVDVTIRDGGLWQPRETPPDRGRGLMLMNRLMDEVTVDRGDGTTVTMSRRVRWMRP